MMTFPGIAHRTEDIRKATYALEGIKRAIDKEQEEDKPNGYTLGAFLSGVAVLANFISTRAYEIDEMLGIKSEG